ncbi:hypothetical protein KP509_27G032300 [Ceratopteris richardii]|uniref:Trichome birefringence-like N-terminal domain-containing protein n=1 Tax=Ceratopteris richardii TaxID=49495 RepID=A0A8T2RHN2_CERRI|nr:hypothetical protein KP509_27G032300 [Ceratopteris richardii]
MKDVKGLTWLYGMKLHLSMNWPTSLSAAGGSVLVLVAIVSVLFLNVWWFLDSPPHQPNVIFLGAGEGADGTAMHAKVDPIFPVPVDPSEEDAPVVPVEANQTSPSVKLLNDVPVEPIPDVRAVPAEVNRTSQVTRESPLSPQPLSETCDLSEGEWIPDPSPPLYTNETCPYIQLSQNCLKNGRPDRDYLQWRWKPFGCELPPFIAARFLKLMRGKKMVFIGDSLARNHMQALLCALTQVEDPVNLFSDPKDKQYKWFFSSYNFTLTNLWSPFLVNYTVEGDIYNLYLDVPEKIWVSELAQYDVAVISTGYWYYRKSLYHTNSKIVGASPNSGLNATRVEILSTMRSVLSNVLMHLTTVYRGVTIFRTITVDHFEHGSWSNGGLCNRTSPFSHRHGDDSLPPFPWMNSEISKVQKQEVDKAMTSMSDSSRLKMINVTYSSYLRPDGHPGPYRIQQLNEPANDCLHWCMPGPIDMWNQLVYHTLQGIFG